MAWVWVGVVQCNALMHDSAVMDLLQACVLYCLLALAEG
jgi:hypothetical protein